MTTVTLLNPAEVKTNGTVLVVEVPNIETLPDGLGFPMKVRERFKDLPFHDFNHIRRMGERNGVIDVPQ